MFKYCIVTLSLLGLMIWGGCEHAAQPIVDTTSNVRVGRDRWIVTDTQQANGKITIGYIEVPENRLTRQGRWLKLKVTILHANTDRPQADPVFVLAGGPGVDANLMRSGLLTSGFRKHRDIVLVSQRGTAGEHRLDIPANSPQKRSQRDLLAPFITAEQAEAAREQLSQKADLTQYSTCNAMDDLNEVREILGYDQINLVGGSYGTRAALVYIRQHPSTVRAAILEGVAPIEFINPLYHAQEAQRALDLIFTEVESDPEYRERFPQLRERFAELLNQFEPGPVRVEYGGETLELTQEMFAAGLRYQLYYLDSSRQVPFQLDQAIRGNFAPFLGSVMARNASLQEAVAMGMLLCVTAAEDLDRIDPAVIESVTQGTFLGDRRIRQQLAAASNWPRSTLPADFGEPVAADVPTLILSGTLDPVTSPRFGDLIQQRFPNSLHVVAPGAHGLDDDCIDALKEQFLEQGSVVGLDCGCVQQMTLPRLRLQ